MRDKKNREKTGETDHGVIDSSSISRLLFYLFVATNLTKILVINKLSALFLRQMGKVLLFRSDFCG